MDSFDEVRFPTDISYGIAGGPEFFTDIAQTQGGHEQRNINWSYSRARYNFSLHALNKEQLDELTSFFRARRGKAIGFRFKDWTDYSALNQLIAVGDGKQADFQLLKNYETVARIVSKPVLNTVIPYVDYNPAEAKIDDKAGIISFAKPPKKGAKITADFEFDVPVRFDNDRQIATIDDWGSYSVRDISLIEVRI